MDSDMSNNTDFEIEYKTIAMRIHKIQILLGYSDHIMASYLGVTEEHFCKKLITGKVPFTLDKLITLREVGFDINYIFTGEVYNINHNQNGQDNIKQIADKLCLVLDEESEECKRKIAKNVISSLLEYI